MGDFPTMNVVSVETRKIGTRKKHRRPYRLYTTSVLRTVGPKFTLPAWHAADGAAPGLRQTVWTALQRSGYRSTGQTDGQTCGRTQNRFKTLVAYYLRPKTKEFRQRFRCRCSTQHFHLHIVSRTPENINVMYMRQVGFNRGDGALYYEHPFSLTRSVLDMNAQTNVGVSGRWLYRVDGHASVPDTARGSSCALPSATGKSTHMH